MILDSQKVTYVSVHDREDVSSLVSLADQVRRVLEIGR